MIPDERDTRRWSSSVVIGTAFTGAFMAWSLCWMHLVHGDGVWETNSDIWFLVHAARFVANGALGYVYSSDPGYLSLPGWAIITAPLIRLGDAVGLVSGSPFPVAHPTLWLLLGPATALAGTPLLAQARALAWELGMRRYLWSVQLLFVAVVLAPCTAWGHGEDMLALAAVLWAVRSLWDAKLDRAALGIALAVCLKQWSVLALPLLVVRAPAGRRLRMTALALAPPAVLASFTLGTDWTHASRALFAPTMDWVHRWHPPLPLLTHLGSHASAVTRLAAVAASPVLAVRTRHRDTRRSLIGLLGVIFLIRALSEPLLFPYYLAPGLGLLGLRAAGAARPERLLWPVAAAVWALPSSLSAWWWPGELLLIGLTLLAALAAVLPGERAGYLEGLRSVVDAGSAAGHSTAAVTAGGNLRGG